MDAETALIKSLLEKHRFGYEVHNTTKPAELQRMKRLCGDPVLAPVVLVNRKIVWTAIEMPVLDVSGQLLQTLQREHKARRARDMYRWGLMYLTGRVSATRTDEPEVEPDELATLLTAAGRVVDPSALAA